MSHTVSARSILLRLSALVFLLALALAPRVAAAQAAQLELDTKYFSIYYPAGEDATAQYYAGFADQMDESVSELLGSAPIDGIKLYIYTTEADYQAANPMAQIDLGVMAHSIPTEKEIGVAVERLRQVPPELATESFRHEMTHIVAGALSGQNLPIGFQEGLAQYDELSTTRAQSVVAELQKAQSNGEALLTWSALNDDNVFHNNIDLGYAEAYSVMAFLADRYGMGDYSVFLQDLSKGQDWTAALDNAYGYTVGDLQQQWTAYLPSFLKTGWQTDVLKDFDMSPGIALFQAGHFTEAVDQFKRSQKLYQDLGRSDLAAQAQAYLTKAGRAQNAALLSDQARKELEAHDYQSASDDALQAEDTFTALSLDSYRHNADETARLAQQGLDAVAELDQARQQAQSFNFGAASSNAHEAGVALAALDDTDRVDEVNQLLNTVALWQRMAALVVLGVGGIAVLFGVVAAIISLRRRKQPAVAALLREENASWL